MLHKIKNNYNNIYTYAINNDSFIKASNVILEEDKASFEVDKEVFSEELERLRDAAMKNDKAQCESIMHEIVPTFKRTPEYEKELAKG